MKRFDKTKTQWIELSLFPVDVGVVLSQEAFNADFGHLYGSNQWSPDYDAKCVFGPGRVPGSNRVIGLCFDPKHMMTITMRQVIGLVVHEASHAAEQLAKMIGEQHSFEGETQAYLMQTLVQVTIKVLQEAKCLPKP